MDRSMPLTEAACTRTSTSPGWASGVGMSASVGWLSKSGKTNARMMLLLVIATGKWWTVSTSPNLPYVESYVHLCYPPGYGTTNTTRARAECARPAGRRRTQPGANRCRRARRVRRARPRRAARGDRPARGGRSGDVVPPLCDPAGPAGRGLRPQARRLHRGDRARAERPGSLARLLRVPHRHHRHAEGRSRVPRHPDPRLPRRPRTPGAAGPRLPRGRGADREGQGHRAPPTGLRARRRPAAVDGQRRGRRRHRRTRPRELRPAGRLPTPSLRLGRGQRTPTACHASADVPRAHPAPAWLAVPPELAESGPTGSPGPSPRPYSPECVEGVFRELRV